MQEANRCACRALQARGSWSRCRYSPEARRPHLNPIWAHRTRSPPIKPFSSKRLLLVGVGRDLFEGADVLGVA
eukprot:8380495-Pyramimonas_sp.AAC.1